MVSINSDHLGEIIFQEQADWRAIAINITGTISFKG
jgi:hypothetical protein